MARRAHDWAWHEARIAEGEMHGQRNGWQLWLAGLRGRMAAFDREPEEFRQLAHEHGVEHASCVRREAQVQQQMAEQCKHGRWRHKCPHCHHEATKGRSGDVIERQAAADRVQGVLERARRRWDAE